MSTQDRYLFVSYARGDVDRVRRVVVALGRMLEAGRASDVAPWMDVTNLRPGEQWADAIASAIESSIGFVFFVSRRSLDSDFVQRELEVATDAADRLIIPVLLEEGLDLPPSIAERQWLSLAPHPTDKDILDVAARIAQATERYLEGTLVPRPPVTTTEAPRIAADIAQQLRSAEPVGADGRPSSVFVVHGHDAEALAQLEEYLTSVDVLPVILARQDDSAQSLLQKFLTIGARARFAIVLLCADDYGASRRQYDAPGVGDRALQFRARQNVVLELGFFYGRLGWENVFVVYREPDHLFPNFERPSDLDGAVFNSIADPDWRVRLGEKLVAAGFELAGR